MELASRHPSLAGAGGDVYGDGDGGREWLRREVQFTDRDAIAGGAGLAGGRASVTATLTTVGVHDIFATYGGDGGSGGVGEFRQQVERVTDSCGS